MEKSWLADIENTGLEKHRQTLRKEEDAMANVGSQVWDRGEQTKKPQAKMIQ